MASRRKIKEFNKMTTAAQMKTSLEKRIRAVLNYSAVVPVYLVCLM